MQMLKKQVQKEDGRYLVYYHFPESATPEETEVFEQIETSAQLMKAGGAPGAAEAGASAQTVKSEE